MAYHPFRHLGLKTLAVAIAVALWYLVSGEQTVERSLRAPLALQNQPEQLELVDNPPAQVDVRVRGATGLLSHLTSGDVVAMVDLSGARAGRRIFPVSRDHVRAPFGVEVTQVTPGTITLRFEPSLSKRVPIEAIVEGEPADGYMVGKVTTEPSTAEVVGAESALRHLTEAVTEPVSVQKASAPVREVVHIGIADSSVRLRGSVVATVTVDVVPMPVSRVIENVPVRIRGIGRRLTAQVVPPTVAVSVVGARATLDGLAVQGLDAYVDLAGLTPGRYNLPVRLDPPQRIQVQRTTPATVRVRIR